MVLGVKELIQKSLFCDCHVPCCDRVGVAIGSLESFQVSCFSFRLCRSNANGLLFLSKTLPHHDLEPVLKNILCLDNGISKRRLKRYVGMSPLNRTSFPHPTPTPNSKLTIPFLLGLRKSHRLILSPLLSVSILPKTS